MANKSLKSEVKAMSDPVQAALLKAAQRKMRCGKPEPPESAEGLTAGFSSCSNVSHQSTTKPFANQVTPLMVLKR